MKGVIGIDEVGRGPLAGPVTVCACFLKDTEGLLEELFDNSLRDSKKLTRTSRINVFKTIRKNRKINEKVVYAVSSRSAGYIDRNGIVPAIRACVASCVKELRRKGVCLEECVIRLDAGLHIEEMKLNQQSFVRGDEQFIEIALASIIAKETRDAHMRRLSKEHAGYGWDRNAGYGTAEHRLAIQKHGISKHHRRSFLSSFKLFEKTE